MSSENLREEIKEVVLEIRQYLCNTEFAPEPFAKPVDPNMLTVEFPNQILSLLKSLTITDWETGFTAFNEPFPFGKKGKLK